MNTVGRYYSSPKKACVNCSSDIPDNANFCMQCGSQAPSSVVGKYVRNDSDLEDRTNHLMPFDQTIAES